MVVTDKTTGMEIFINFSNALNLDFEPSGITNALGFITNKNGSIDITTGAGTTNSSSDPRIRSIKSGPFGIQFRSIEGGGTD
jgi:hypothetical protein